MALSGPATTPFLDEGLQPFEEALNLRRRTPSPRPDGKDRASVYTAGMSTRELQAIYRQSTSFPAPQPLQHAFESRSTSDDGSSPEDEIIKAPRPVLSERPLDQIHRQSLSYDSLPILKAPRRTVGPETDPVFGLDIRDCFGWTFEDSTPYDVLLPTPPPSSRPLSLEPRRSSTPSLSSSPATSSATSSATTSTLSSLQTPGATYGSDYGFARRRVSSMGDVPSLANVPLPQPIPLGKSRMNNEMHYDSSSPEAMRKGFAAFFKATLNPKLDGQKPKEAAAAATQLPAAKPASEGSEKTRIFRSRSALSLPILRGKPKVAPLATAAPLPTPPAPTKATPKERTRGADVPTTRGRPIFSVGSVLSKAKPAAPQLPRAVSAPIGPTVAKSTPANLPIAAAMSQEQPMDVRLSKRQSEDLLYKKASSSSLRAASTSPEVYLARQSSKKTLQPAADKGIRKKLSSNSMRSASSNAEVKLSLQPAIELASSSPLPGLAASSRVGSNALHLQMVNKPMPSTPGTAAPANSPQQWVATEKTRRSTSLGR